MPLTSQQLSAASKGSRFDSSSVLFARDQEGSYLLMPTEVASIRDHLKKHSEISYLLLKYCMLNAQKLAKLLPGMMFIQNLDVSHNPWIGDEGAKLIATLPLLKVLTVADCAIGDEGVGVLAQAVSLVYLNLRDNVFSDNGLQRLLQNPKLTALDIAGNSFYEPETMQLLQNSTSLAKLSVSFRFFEVPEEIQLMQAIALNCYLTRLDLVFPENTRLKGKARVDFLAWLLSTFILTNLVELNLKAFGPIKTAAPHLEQKPSCLARCFGLNKAAREEEDLEELENALVNFSTRNELQTQALTAAAENDVATLQSLLLSGAVSPFTYETAGKKTLLHLAAASLDEDSEMVTWLLTQYPSSQYILNGNGNLPLKSSSSKNSSSSALLICEDNMGATFRKMWSSQTVLVKELVCTKESTAIKDRLIAEVTQLKKLKHVNVLICMGLSTDSLPYAIIFENFNGKVLSEFLKLPSATVSPETRSDIAYQIAAGLAYLHEAQVLHRDLNTGAVLINDKNQVKLTNYGFEKVKTETSTLATYQKSKKIDNTAWLAPELFKRRAIYTDKSDVYALGILLWVIFAWRQPSEKLKQDEHDEIPATFPPKISALIKNCWFSEADKRPSAKEAVAVFGVRQNKGAY